MAQTLVGTPLGPVEDVEAMVGAMSLKNITFSLESKYSPPCKDYGSYQIDYYDTARRATLTFTLESTPEFVAKVEMMLRAKLGESEDVK